MITTAISTGDVHQDFGWCDQYIFFPHPQDSAISPYLFQRVSALSFIDFWQFNETRPTASIRIRERVKPKFC